MQLIQRMIARQTVNRHARIHFPAICFSSAAVASESVPVPSSVAHSTPAWQDLKLSPTLVASLTKHKFKAPTPIQAQTLEALVKAGVAPAPDSTLLAETGSGKTLAFLLPVLQALYTEASPSDRFSQPFALVLVPSNELVMQVQNVCRTLAPDVPLVPVFSGFKENLERLLKRMSIQRVIDDKTKKGKSVRLTSSSHDHLQLKRSMYPPIIVATPGVLLNLEPTDELGHLLRPLRFIVVDEADLLLSDSSHAALPLMLRQARAAARRCARALKVEQEAQKMHELEQNAQAKLSKSKDDFWADEGEGEVSAADKGKKGSCTMPPEDDSGMEDEEDHLIEASPFRPSNKPVFNPRLQFLFSAATFPSGKPNTVGSLLAKIFPDLQTISTPGLHAPVPTLQQLQLFVAAEVPEEAQPRSVVVRPDSTPESLSAQARDRDAAEKRIAELHRNAKINRLVDVLLQIDEFVAKSSKEDRFDSKKGVSSERKDMNLASMIEHLPLSGGPLKIMIFVNSTDTAELLHRKLCEDERFKKLEVDGAGHKDAGSKNKRAGQSASSVPEQAMARGQARSCGPTPSPSASSPAFSFHMLHKGVQLEERNRTLRLFGAEGGGQGPKATAPPRQRHLVLICTDYLSRGLDLADVHLVVQFDFALSSVAYLHRVGRTARNGKSGCVLSLVGPHETSLATIVASKASTPARPTLVLPGTAVPSVPPLKTLSRAEIERHLPTMAATFSHNRSLRNRVRRILDTRE